MQNCTLINDKNIIYFNKYGQTLYVIYIREQFDANLRFAKHTLILISLGFTLKWLPVSY